MSSLKQSAWQLSKSSLKDCFSFLCCNNCLADVHFVLQNIKGKGPQPICLPAHKFLLSARSPIFEAMFNGPMAQEDTETIEEIEVPDIEPSAFKALLKFIYTDEIDIGAENVVATLYTAKKYQVPMLEKSCVDFLKQNLTAENAFTLLIQARLFDESELLAHCIEMIDSNTTEAFNATGFTDIDHETLCLVLERDSLCIREAVLYDAVVRWSTQECERQKLTLNLDNRREVLGRALHLVRFPLMSLEEFAEVVGKDAEESILTDTEELSLFRYFTVKSKPQLLFSDAPRLPEFQTLNLFKKMDMSNPQSCLDELVRGFKYSFSVNRNVFIVGFGVYGSKGQSGVYKTNIEVANSRVYDTCHGDHHLCDTTFSSDGCPKIVRIPLKEPVKILQNVDYTVSGTITGPPSYSGMEIQSHVVHQYPNIGPVIFDFDYGNFYEEGQMAQILFYLENN